MSTNAIADPVRIKNFLDSIGKLDWKEVNASIDTLCREAFELLRHEVDYYYEIRKSKKRLSFWVRISVLIFGSLGMLAPLADAAKLYEGASELGYLFLVVAGIFMAANSLFGGTSGHGRIVTTQLSLEKVIAVGTVKWNELRSRLNEAAEADKPAIAREMFDFITRILESGYQLILDETSDWAKTLNEAVSDYQKGISKRNG